MHATNDVQVKKNKFPLQQRKSCKTKAIGNRKPVLCVHTTRVRKVICSAVTKIKLFGQHGNLNVSQKINPSDQPENSIPILRHSVDSIMLWGFIKIFCSFLQQECRR